MNITIHSKGVQQGPFPAEQVKQLLQSGQVAQSDLGWSPGMAEWRPLSSFPELQNPSAPPPVPRMGVPLPVTGSTVTEPLAIWSLVLGSISIVGCAFGGFLTAIPAVICGHIGRSKISKDPHLSGAGMALAGLITGYFGLMAVPLVIAAIAIPNIAGITQQANITAARRNAQNIASIASAARAAGYTGKWATKEDAIQDLITGVTVRNGGQEIGPFRVDGLPPDTSEISKYLRLEGDNLTYVP